MNAETPLDEVVGWLPPTAIVILEGVTSEEVRILVLQQVRRVMTYWEDNGLLFDPVSLEAFLSALVASHTPLLLEIVDQRATIAALSSQLAAAENQNEGGS